MALIYRRSLDVDLLSLMQVPMESSINDAIKRGFLQQVRFLIEYGHSVNERDESFRTPLINCALIEDESWGAGLARLFIEKGAKITLRDKRGLNALHYACVYNRYEIVDVYLKALDFDLTLVDKFGNTALHYAARVGSRDICSMLVGVHKRYLLPTDIQNRRRETPLVMAWKAGYIECGQFLVDECQANTDQKDIDGVAAKQWYDISLRKLQARVEEHKQKENKTRPRTATARLQRLATPKGMSGRPSSAPPVSILRRRNHVFTFRQKENMSADPVQILKGAQTNLYKPASHSDLRNKPEYVFQLSAADCFVNQARYPMSEVSRSRSTAHINHISKNETINSSWRESIKSFFTTYDYQFSHSFCRGAIPPEPDCEPNPDERVASPTPTHVSEPGDSEVGSVTSLKKVPKKVGNAFSAVRALTSALDKGDKRRQSRQEKGVSGAMSRKVSTLQAPQRSG